jgi:hypothetical protein
MCTVESGGLYTAGPGGGRVIPQELSGQILKGAGTPSSRENQPIKGPVPGPSEHNSGLAWRAKAVEAGDRSRMRD